MGAMSEVMLRLATDAKIPTRERWDLDPHVISSTSDDPDMPVARAMETR